MQNVANRRLRPRHKTKPQSAAKPRRKDWPAKAVEDWLHACGVKTYSDFHRARLHRIYVAIVVTVILSFACGVGIGVGIVAANHHVTTVQSSYRLVTWEPSEP